MKKNIYEKYTILATYAFIVMFSSIAYSATRSDSTTRGSLWNMEPSPAELRKPHIGVQVGYAEPERNGYSGATQLGVEMGYQPYLPLGAAIELTTFSSDKEVSDFRRTNLMAKGTYNFGGSTPIIKHSFVGAAAGPVYDSEGGDEELNLGVKFLAGFDFPLTGSQTTRTNSFTLGAAANYLVVANAQDNFLVNGQLKYWF